MTTIPRPDHDDAPLPPDLAAGLRGLGGDIAPGRDLWPGIAARLEPRAAASRQETRPMTPRGDRRRHFRRRDAAYAAAAAVVVAVAIGWQMLPVRTAVDPAADPGNVVATGPTADADAPLLRAADALAREYQGAMREVQASTGSRSAGGAPPTDAAGGLDAELERSAAEVRAALARDPDAVYLFHNLQRIYAHRLALNLRQA
jgi:hypothetical protein